MDPELRATHSRRISRNIVRSRYFLTSETIAAYFAMPDEVDVGPIFEHAWRSGKTICAPVLIDRREMRFAQVLRETPLRRNRFGIWEPVSDRYVSARKIDVVVVPLVAFDDDGNRIGMGGGYYDRCFHFLKTRRQWRRPKLVAAAFNSQKTRKIAANPWDIPVYKTVTETG